MQTKDIVFLQELERKRIAEELHDTTVQDMVYLSQQLELILLYMDKDIARAKSEIISTQKYVKSMIHGVRETIYDLRPMIFDEIGWHIAFEHLRKKLSEINPTLNVYFDIDDIDLSDQVIAISVYRIVCECCRNILKHSRASGMVIFVKCLYKKYVKIFVRDDGVGFDKDTLNEMFLNKHFGLKFIEERVKFLSGVCKIHSDSFGASVQIVIPLEIGR